MENSSFQKSFSISAGGGNRERNQFLDIAAEGGCERSELEPRSGSRSAKPILPNIEYARVSRSDTASREAVSLRAKRA